MQAKTISDNATSYLHNAQPRLSLNSSIEQRRRVECLITFAEQQLKQDNRETARQTFYLVLKTEPGNEQATLGLCKLTEDLDEQERLLKALLELRPESEAGRAWLNQIEVRRNLLNEVELEEMVRSSAYLKLWDERIKQHEERLRFNRDQRTAPISQLGELLLKAGCLNQQQLETALSLQAMLQRLGERQKLGQVLIDYGYITKAQLDEALEMQENEFRSQMY